MRSLPRAKGKSGTDAAGRLTEAGKRVREAVLHGIPEALTRHDAGMAADRPAFFIFSRIKGEHWIEWSPENCPYYPCHFEGQSCEFCYCPFYPCRDESLGQWAESSNGGRVWNCARCTLLHEPAGCRLPEEISRGVPGRTDAESVTGKSEDLLKRFDGAFSIASCSTYAIKNQNGNISIPRRNLKK